MTGRRAEAVLGRVAQRLGISVGQAYTAATGLTVAVTLAVVGLPPVLDGVDRSLAAPAGEASPVGEGTSGPALGPDLAAELAIGLAPVLQGGSSGSFPPPRTADGRPADRPAGPQATVPAAAAADGPLGTTRRFAPIPDPGAPAGVAVGPDGTVFVTTDNALTRGGSGASALLAFDPAGQLVGTWLAEGQASPRSHGLTDVAVDGTGAAWVLDASSARVLRLDRAAGALVAVAEVPDLPACVLGLVAAPCEPGMSDGAPELRGLAARPGGGVLVADRAQGIVWSIAPSGAVAAFAAVDDRLAGEGPVDVAVLADGSLAVAVSARLGSAPPGLPSVLRIPMSGGTAGAPEVVADLGLDDAPTSVVATASDRLYVALSGTNEVMDLGLEQGDQIRHGAGLDPAFDVPTGLALRDGSLLVTNQGPAGAGPDRWAVLAVAVADRPPT